MSKLNLLSSTVMSLALLASCEEAPNTTQDGKAPGVDGGRDAISSPDGASRDSGTTDGPRADQQRADQQRADQGPPPANAYFPPGAIWYQDHSKAPVNPRSDQIINNLSAAGGWGGGTFRIDFLMEVLEADASTPRRSFTPSGDHFTPDCDIVKVPVPKGGSIEGEDGYECTHGGDCHLIVVDRAESKLYEMWVANISGGTFEGGCLAVWDMTRVYGEAGRGYDCTSADAAGFPIAPLLATADEVKAGEIKHALRFILPNDRVKHFSYVYPATHSTNPTSGGKNAPPYGVHLRLKASFDESKLKPGAQVVARALKKYGMFHADGGVITLTVQSDKYTKAKWDGLLGPRDLESLKVTDFEVVDQGPEREYKRDCKRAP